MAPRDKEPAAVADLELSQVVPAVAEAVEALLLQFAGSGSRVGACRSRQGQYGSVPGDS